MGIKRKQQPYCDYAGRSCVCLCEPTPVAQVRLHGMHLFTLHTAFACFLVWVSEFVYDWLAKHRSGWEYKLGRHIKSCVSCWSGFTWGTAHSLYFPAFQLVYSGTCQASPHLKKAFGMSLTLSQRETSTFFPPGYRACQKYKRRKLPLCRFRRYCVWFWYSICCLWFLAENWQTSSGFHFPFADCVCVHCEKCSWCRMEKKQELK